MTEDIWGEKPELVWVPRGYHSTSKIKEDDIQMILIDHAWLEKLKAYYEPIEKQAETLRFLFGDEGVKTENLMKIQIWREKAERWDQYAIYDNDNEPKILVKDLLSAYETLEAVKTWLIKAKAEGRISMSTGFTLDRILGAEE